MNRRPEPMHVCMGSVGDCIHKKRQYQRYCLSFLERKTGFEAVSQNVNASAGDAVGNFRCHRHRAEVGVRISPTSNT